MVSTSDMAIEAIQSNLSSSLKTSVDALNEGFMPKSLSLLAGAEGLQLAAQRPFTECSPPSAKAVFCLMPMPTGCSQPRIQVRIGLQCAGCLPRIN
jgi:hypothetical protein